jgi:hypothetical protein
MQTIRRRRVKKSRRQERFAENPQKEGHGEPETGKRCRLSAERGTRSAVDRKEMQKIHRRRDKESSRQERDADNPQKEGHKEL